MSHSTTGMSNLTLLCGQVFIFTLQSKTVRWMAALLLHPLILFSFISSKVLHILYKESKLLSRTRVWMKGFYGISGKQRTMQKIFVKQFHENCVKRKLNIVSTQLKTKTIILMCDLISVIKWKMTKVRRINSVMTELIAKKSFTSKDLLKMRSGKLNIV